MTTLELILSVATATLLVLVSLLIKSYLPAYVKEKAINLATTEDIADITKQIERVRADISQETVLLEKRREVYERIADAMRIFISGHPSSDEIRDEFHSAYSACWLWAPDNLISVLNQFIKMQLDYTSDPASHSQMEMKKLYGKVILAMRQDVGFESTNVNEESYRFVQF